jgi:hypothetical protein
MMTQSRTLSITASLLTFHSFEYDALKEMESDGPSIQVCQGRDRERRSEQNKPESDTTAPASIQSNTLKGMSDHFGKTESDRRNAALNDFLTQNQSRVDPRTQSQQIFLSAPATLTSIE